MLVHLIKETLAPFTRSMRPASGTGRRCSYWTSPLYIFIFWSSTLFYSSFFVKFFYSLARLHPQERPSYSNMCAILYIAKTFF
jgi:hypothetical protein